MSSTTTCQTLRRRTGAIVWDTPKLAACQTARRHPLRRRPLVRTVNTVAPSRKLRRRLRRRPLRPLRRHRPGKVSVMMMMMAHHRNTPTVNRVCRVLTTRRPALHRALRLRRPRRRLRRPRPLAAAHGAARQAALIKKLFQSSSK